MADLPSWVILSLPQAWSPAELVERANLLGARASLTRDGIHFGGSFLGRIEPIPFPRGMLDSSVAEGDITIGNAVLHLSGGTNELEREAHQRPAALRAIAHAAAMKALGTVDPNAPIESAASRKMMSLTRLVHTLCPLATAVILPRANHLVFDARAFAKMAAEYLEGGAYTFPVWSFLKVREDEGCSFVASTGMWPFGLPDVGMPFEGPAELDERVHQIGFLQREMVAEGWWPEDGATFTTKRGPVTTGRAWDAVWALPASGATRGSEIARRRFARQRQMSVILGGRTHHHRPGNHDQFAIEHFLSASGDSMAITNGLSDQPQPGGSAADENDFVELVLTSRVLGPWADGWLDWASQYMRGHDGSHPIRPRDRLVLPQPMHGIAGAIVWAFGHLSPERPSEPTIQLWDLIPFSVDELAHFRADPRAQAAWMDERIERNDFEAVHERWTAASGR